MWRDPPASASVDASEHDSDNDTDEEVEHATVHRKGPQLRDENGFCYFGPAEQIHELLDVNLYVPVVPLAPRTPCLHRAAPTLPNNAMVAPLTTSAGL